MSAASRIRRWRDKRRWRRIEYQLFEFSRTCDRAARAWHEMVRARSAIEETPETGGEE